MSTLTPVPDCEDSPIVIGGSATVNGATVCGSDPADPCGDTAELLKEIRCLRSEVVELQRKVRKLNRESLKYVTSPSDQLTGLTVDGNTVAMPIPAI